MKSLPEMDTVYSNGHLTPTGILTYLIHCGEREKIYSIQTVHPISDGKYTNSLSYQLW